MTRISLDYDLEDVSTDFEPMPVGQYQARIENPDDCTLVEASTGKDMLKIIWTIVDGEFEGRKVFDNVVLTVKFKVKQYCEAAGIGSGAEFDSDDFVGMEALLQIIQEEYNNRTQNKIKNIQPMS